MPIDVEEAPEAELRRTGGGPTNAERVLVFLDEHDDQAFTPKEIREATGVPRGSIGVVLSRLEDRVSSGIAASTGRSLRTPTSTSRSRALGSPVPRAGDWGAKTPQSGDRASETGEKSRYRRAGKCGEDRHHTSRPRRIARGWS